MAYKFPKKTIKDIDLTGKRILIRADFNVPLTSDGEIESDYRITQTLPTLQYLLERKCTVIVVAHLGRPEGRPDPAFSLEPVAQLLQKLLPDFIVNFAASTVDDAAWQACNNTPDGSLILLENLRFDPREEANDSQFAAALKRVSGAQYFVQEGFGVVHRAHASTEAITHQLPSLAGLLLEKEVSTLEQAMKHPEHPLIAVVGGAKISDKIGFIEQLLSIADTILIGGAMANTFLKYQGFEVGKSKVETGQESEIATILQKANDSQLVFPTDVTTVKKIATDSQITIRQVDHVLPDEYILDVGPDTAKNFDSHLKRANTAIWNGTLGMAEMPEFAKGSAKLASELADSHHSITSIVGGGDTADFVLAWLSHHKSAKFSHISTGGGASLELMSGLKLPGVEALLGN